MAYSSQKHTAILRTKLENPEMSLREIWDKHKVCYTTVKKIIDAVPEKTTKYNKDEKIVEWINEIMDNITKITKTRIDWIVGDDEKIEWLWVRELKQLEEINWLYFQRKQLLQWKPTSIEKVDVNFEEMSTKELEEFRQYLLNNRWN